MTSPPRVVLHADRLQPAAASGTLDLSCEPGSITVLTGPSAAETTCWLETLAGLRPSRGGQLRLLGTRAESGNNPRRLIGYVDANAPLLSTFDVRMNVMLPRLYHHRESRVAVLRLAERMLDRVGYRGPRDRVPAVLSPLEHMQSLLARALMLEPPLLFIDEPFDIETVIAWRELAASLAALARDDERALVIATRNLAFAAGCADRVVFIDDAQTGVYESWDDFARAAEPATFIGALPFALEERP